MPFISWKINSLYLTHGRPLDDRNSYYNKNIFFGYLFFWDYFSLLMKVRHGTSASHRFEELRVPIQPSREELWSFAWIWKENLKHRIANGLIVIAISSLPAKAIHLGCIPVAYPVTLLRVTVVIINATCDSPFIRWFCFTEFTENDKNLIVWITPN